MKYLDKKKVRDAFVIADIVKMYSNRFEVRGRTIVFICPFHNDSNLGSCWAYLDAHSFTCSACRERADVLKLASAYTGIALTDMNSLLEELVKQFGLPRENYIKDGSSVAFNKIDTDELLNEQEYQRLLGTSFLKKPVRKMKFKDKDIVTHYDYLSFPALARRDKKAYDNNILIRSRSIWRKLNALKIKAKTDKDFCYYCETLFLKGGMVKYADNSDDDEPSVRQIKERKRAYEVFECLIIENERLLQKALLDKSLYEAEIQLRKEIASREELKKDIIKKMFQKKKGCI